MAIVTLDLDTLTLGELAAAEKASGLDTTVLLSRSAHRIMLGVFVQRLRNSGQAPSWSDLGNLRLLEVSSSLSASELDSPGPKSSG